MNQEILFEPDFVLLGQKQPDGKVMLVAVDGADITRTVITDNSELQEILGGPYWYGEVFDVLRRRDYTLELRTGAWHVVHAKTFTAALKTMFGQDARLVPRKLKWRKR